MDRKIQLFMSLGNLFRKMGIRKTATQKYQFPGEWLRACVMIFKSVFPFSIFKLKTAHRGHHRGNKVKATILDGDIWLNISYK